MQLGKDSVVFSWSYITETNGLHCYTFQGQIAPGHAVYYQKHISLWEASKLLNDCKLVMHAQMCIAGMPMSIHSLLVPVVIK